MPLRVMVVEDDPASREGLAAALADAGMHVDTAASAEDAMALLDGHPPDVIVSDVSMGEKSGLDLLAFVRARYPGTAVILVTANPTEQVRQAAFAAGAFELFAKPLKLDLIEEAVHRAARIPHQVAT